MKVSDKFYMDTDNGTGPYILHRKNDDGTVSFATIEDVEAFVLAERARGQELRNKSQDVAEKILEAQERAQRRIDWLEGQKWFRQALLANTDRNVGETVRQVIDRHIKP